jgi:Selenocysteine lyase
MSKYFDATAFRNAFPAVNKLGMVYLDSAATSLKPDVMTNVITDYLSNNGATVHRSLHAVGKQATEQYESARNSAAELINSQHVNHVIWTSGTTASLNLVAYGYLRNILSAGDEIIINDSEHHSNIIPWLMIAKEKGAVVKKIPLDTDGRPRLETLEGIITRRTKFISISQMSNVTGFMPDLEKIITLAHKHDIRVSVDGAQGVVHHPLNVQHLGVDFYSFSAHKLYGPNGVGVLYYSERVASEFSPVYGGGQMLYDINDDIYSFKAPPFRYEAGTPNIMGIIGFGATLSMLKDMDFKSMTEHCSSLANKARDMIQERIPDVDFYSVKNSTILSFNINGMHHVDISTLLSESGISLRSGKHCAIPLMKHFSVSGTLRASFSPYNNEKDVVRFIAALQNAYEVLK